MYTKKFTFLILSALLSIDVGGQEEVTNAFNDLQRTGIVQGSVHHEKGGI